MDGLYTVKQMADILNVSKPTVQRAINAAEIVADLEDNKQCRFYSYEKVVAIISSIDADFDFSAFSPQTATPQQIGETPQSEPQNEAKQTATPQQTSELELVKSMLATIQEQLAIKDKQIAAFEEQLAIKDKQIQDYSARLAEAMQLTKGQQYIAAADKVERITAAQAVPEDEQVVSAEMPVQQPAEPEQKQSFWRRLFGK